MVDSAFVKDVEKVHQSRLEPVSPIDQPIGQKALYLHVQDLMNDHGIKANSPEAREAVKKLVDDHILGSLEIDMTSDALLGHEFHRTAPNSEPLIAMDNAIAKIEADNKKLGEQLKALG